MSSKKFEEERRTEAFAKDSLVEAKLQNLNDILESMSRNLLTEFSEPSLPTIFIVGVPRSGSTLLSQLMASTGGFSYVSNFVAKFWATPYLGMLIEDALGLKEGSQKVQFSSEYGRTSDWNGPHEFGYFWQRWFSFGETHKVQPSDLEKIDVSGLRREIAALESVREKPLFFKNLICGLQIDFLSEIFPKSVFVVCERDILFNMQSLLISREEVLGDRKNWWSLKPKEYPNLKKLNPFEQVATQISYINRDIDTALAALDQGRQLRLRYEEICDDPKGEIRKVIDLVGEAGIYMDCDLSGMPKRFLSDNVFRFKRDEVGLLEEAKRKYFG